jgi:hypothetical protein
LQEDQEGEVRQLAVVMFLQAVAASSSSSSQVV